jgi:hypothetical protein
MCLVAFSGMAQREDYIRPGLLKASATISPGWMLNKPELNYNVSGFLEGYLEKKLSLRGETHYFVDGKNDVPFYKFNSRTFFGVLYHVNKNNLDGHVGFMPGVSFIQVNGDLNSSGKNPVHVVPSFSANIGLTFYVWKFCHFFANATYVHSTINGLKDVDGRSDEFMISAGLGFNVNMLKAK